MVAMSSGSVTLGFRAMTIGSMTDSTGAIISAFDHVWTRLRTRIDGLTDEEYFWEPVPGAWSLRLESGGRWLLDGGGGAGPAPDPAPVTTIAWRLGHLGGMALGGSANWRFGDGTLRPDAIDFPSDTQYVGEFLEGNYRLWRDSLAGLEDDQWGEPLGTSWGAYADDDTFDLALHVLDEVIHHGAEVGLLRDLYPQRQRPR